MVTPSQSLDDGGTESDIRDDVHMEAGLVEYDGELALAVLATPTNNAATPIGPTDKFTFDLTGLGLEPGTVIRPG